MRSVVDRNVAMRRMTVYTTRLNTKISTFTPHSVCVCVCVCVCLKINNYHFFVQPSPIGQRRFWFDPGSAHVRFVLDRVAARRGFPPNTSVYPPSVSLHHFHVHILTQGQTVEAWEPWNKTTPCQIVRYREAISKVLLHYSCFSFERVKHPSTGCST
jgi:hypothetical protein